MKELMGGEKHFRSSAQYLTVKRIPLLVDCWLNKFWKYWEVLSIHAIKLALLAVVPKFHPKLLFFYRNSMNRNYFLFFFPNLESDI